MSVQAIATPSAEQLLALEHQARQHGTGLDAPALQGCWQLELVWPKGSGKPSAFSGWLLRGLSARLEISAEAEGLALSNAQACCGACAVDVFQTFFVLGRVP